VINENIRTEQDLLFPDYSELQLKLSPMYFSLLTILYFDIFLIMTIYRNRTDSAALHDILITIKKQTSNNKTYMRKQDDIFFSTI